MDETAQRELADAHKGEIDPDFEPRRVEPRAFPISFRLNSAQYERLRQLSQIHDLDLSATLRMLIEEAPLMAVRWTSLQVTTGVLDESARMAAQLREIADRIDPEAAA